MHYALLLFPQYEPLDAFGPTEVLHCLAHHPPTNPSHASLRLSILGPTLSPISSGPCKNDPAPKSPLVAQTILPTHTYASPPEDIDVLIVPGGYGAGPKELFDGKWEPEDIPEVVEFLRVWYPRVRYLLTVCNGAGLAARAGILDGQKATTNKMAWKAITALGRKTFWVARARWVVADGGKLWTSSGVSAGTDAMLALVDHVYGRNEKGILYGDVVKEAMEWIRVYDSEADPFAVSNRVQDVSPLE